MAMLINAVIRHEPTDDCWDWHCVIHDVDEVGDGYLRCGECGHLYLTRRELRKAYRRMIWGINGGLRKPLGQKGWSKPLWVRLWDMATVRADKVYWCMECAHNF